MLAGMQRLNRVQIDADGTIVNLPWPLSLELRERLARADRRDLAERFAAAGATRPVKLTREEADVVLALMEEWEREISRLRGALRFPLERRGRPGGTKT